MRKNLTAGFALVSTILILGSVGLTSAAPVKVTKKHFHIYLDFSGDYEYGDSVLYNDIFLPVRDYDVFHLHFTFSGSVDIEIFIEDYGVMGDTMCLLYSRKHYWMATSPKDIHLYFGAVTVSPGMEAILYVFYYDCPGGFPAHYGWSFWVDPPT